MSRDLDSVRNRFARWWFFRRVVKALLVNKRRRAIRMDGLSLREYPNRLQIEWIAREVHPRNRDLPRIQIAELFAEQCLDDTGAAIDRLFRELPEVEFIDFRCLTQNPRSPFCTVLPIGGTRMPSMIGHTEEARRKVSPQ
jgi:hypothetical protein